MASNDTVIKTVTDHITQLRIDLATNIQQQRDFLERYEREKKIEDDVHNALGNTVDKHRHALFGNGDPGVVDDVREIKRGMKIALAALAIIGAAIVGDFYKASIGPMLFPPTDGISNEVAQ